MLQTSFYNPDISYEENYEKGPFGEFTTSNVFQKTGEPEYDFLGHKVFTPFGIPAGPLVNAKFVLAAFRKGFDICVYKTVRKQHYSCHAWPNVLAVHEEKLGIDRKEPVIADNNYTQPLSITNSFGVPSASPEIWQPDMAKAVRAAGKGQVLVGSFQGTTSDSGSVESYIMDFVETARLVKETGVPILEANLSCPNEGNGSLLCFDIERTFQIATEIRKAIGSTPLILKLAFFKDDQILENFVKKLAPVADGFSAINTIAATIITPDGKQALPGKGRERSGVCGSAITWAGLDMVARLQKLKEKLGLDYTIVGVGGVTHVEDFFTYRQAGADAVMSATGAMWNPFLAKEIMQKSVTMNT